jgi:glyoxylase-like metal-dependent hydrolase (beta-lactamase superfamily II)
MIDFSPKHNVWIRNDDGTMNRMDEPYFQSWKLAEGVWRVVSSGDYSYLVEGDDEAVVIDSGYGAGNIREYMETLVGKPVRRIANTHYHFDHTANNSYFEMAYMSQDTVPLATIPYPSFEGITFPRDYPITVLQNGDTIPLKGRDLQAFLIPDHAVGSMAFLDRKGRILFSGDEFMGKRKKLSGGLTSWVQSLERLAAVRGEFDVMYGGAFTVEGDVVDKMLQAARIGLETGGEPFAFTGFGGPGTGGLMRTPEYNEAGELIYGRMAPHPGDGGPRGGEKPEDLRRAAFEDVEVIFNITKINE